MDKQRLIGRLLLCESSPSPSANNEYVFLTVAQHFLVVYLSILLSLEQSASFSVHVNCCVFPSKTRLQRCMGTEILWMYGVPLYDWTVLDIC